MEISVETVRFLVGTQFPEWRNLSIEPVRLSGHDNRTFHLGDSMLVRLPSAAEYAPQVVKEYQWLPFLQQHLSVPIPVPVGTGRPCEMYPFPWSVNRYIRGETVTRCNVSSMKAFAQQLAAFLQELQTVDPLGAPLPGKHNFYRGGNLEVYHNETAVALADLEHCLPVEALRQIWQRALETRWLSEPVWIHGDVAPRNLLVAQGNLCGVIDFGMTGIGDPACDYAMAWTFFEEDSRRIFLKGLDQATIDRAKGWALWKALITYGSNPESEAVIGAVLYDEGISEEQYH